MAVPRIWSYGLFVVIFLIFYIQEILISSGPSCSKLTTSLVNNLLKFRSSDTQICRNVLLKKCE